MPEWFITLGYIFLTVIMIGGLASTIFGCILIVQFLILGWKEEREFKKVTEKRKREG